MVSEDLKPGNHEATWDARQTNGGQATGFASGMYFYRLQVHPDAVGAGGFVKTKKLLLLR